MINEMSLDMFGEVFSVFAAPPSAEEIKLATALAEDAARYAAEAAEQQDYAETARVSMQSAKVETRGELARIAVWHYGRCAESFRRSGVGFESAAKIEKRENARLKLLKKAAAMADSARRSERAALELEPIGNNEKGGSGNETG